MNDPLTTASLIEKPPGSGAGRPCLFVAMECTRLQAGVLRVPLRRVPVLMLGRGDPRGFAPLREEGADGLELHVPDRHLSSRHLRVQRIGPSHLLEDLGSKNGTLLDGRPVRREPLHDGDVIQAGETFLVFRATAVPDDAELGPEEVGGGEPPLSTASPVLARDLEQLAAVAPTQVPVLLLGETGTGKEMAARYVHTASGRSGELVAVNCGALPDQLVLSELFGHRRGAFSGATEDRAGMIRAAHGGTLFLDEIGDLPLPAQASLLRVLQEREVRPVGGAPVAVDVRIVCATHRDLPSMVREGVFREDLLGRIAGFTLRLPPLRERLEDLGLVTAALLRRLAPSRTVYLAPAAARDLFRHAWPRNVRELEHTLGRALALSSGEVIEAAHLQLELERVERAVVVDSLDEGERALRDRLLASLEEHRGNVSAVARALGKDRTQVRRWIARFGLGSKSS